ncbi:hypothetical protein BHF71_02765 [Vulcanibacillus modesticaldus]|uniref:Uncharacterized protein n=1 Tax=Vulcanibacillus modesticaldus TaxID=337097 RepID=A0A1D2YT68_9BACI|nr:hypothetical protein [Vulcanibacillus modesticaldus]OEF98866.1 hypothetical protein BHF71_02765 [Vulcanibacillus modesticaldus]
MNEINPLKALIQIYKALDESKILLEDIIDQIGSGYGKRLEALPEDIQVLVEKTLELTPKQRKALMRFIESIKSD